MAASLGLVFKGAPPRPTMAHICMNLTGGARAKPDCLLLEVSGLCWRAKSELSADSCTGGTKQP